MDKKTSFVASLFFCLLIFSTFKLEGHKTLKVRLLGKEKIVKILRDDITGSIYIEKEKGVKRLIENEYLSNLLDLKNTQQVRVKEIEHKLHYPVVLMDYWTMVEIILGVILVFGLTLVTSIYGTQKSEKFNYFFRTKYPLIFLGFCIIIIFVPNSHVVKTRLHGEVMDVTITIKDKHRFYFKIPSQKMDIPIDNNIFDHKKYKVGDRIKIKILKDEETRSFTAIPEGSIANTELGVLIFCALLIATLMNKKVLWKPRG